MSTYEISKNLKRDDKDNVRQTISNYVYVLNHDPVLRGNVRYNIMTERDCIAFLLMLSINTNLCSFE